MQEISFFFFFLALLVLEPAWAIYCMEFNFCTLSLQAAFS
jgi:hypothetical protein